MITGGSTGASAALPPWLNVPSSWGASWGAAKKTGSARVSLVGDSITQIFAASSRTKSWAGLLTAALQAAHGDGGSGFLGAANTDIYMPASFALGYTTAQLGVTHTGTWTTATHDSDPPLNGDGPGAVMLSSTANGSTLTFAAVRGTIVQLIYAKSATASAGIINWTIDGVAQTPISVDGGASLSVNTVTVSGLTAGAHTVVITANVTNGTTFTSLFGVRGLNAAGVVVDNYGLSNAATPTFINMTNNVGLPADWSGGQSLPADLLIYALGVNDASRNTDPETYINNVRTQLTEIRDKGALSGATDLIFLLPHIGTWEGSNHLYGDYLIRLRGLAASYGAALVDVWSAYRNSRSYGLAQSYFGVVDGTGHVGTDAVHPGDLGHQQIYNLLAAIPGLL